MKSSDTHKEVIQGIAAAGQQPTPRQLALSWAVAATPLEVQCISTDRFKGT